MNKGEVRSLDDRSPSLALPAADFQKRLVSQFDYAVTPLVFDLKLAIQSSGGLASNEGWRILQVYGSPNNDSTLNSDGTIMTVRRAGLGGGGHCAREWRAPIVHLRYCRW